MKRPCAFCLFLLVVFCFPAGVLFSQEISAKIAFVDTAAVLQGTAEGQKELAAIEQLMTQQRSQLETEVQELNSLKEQFSAQAAALNLETRSEMQRTIVDKEKELVRHREDIESDLGRRQEELLARMADKIRGVIEGYATENGLGAVFIMGPQMPWVGEAADITSAVIELYDQKYPVAEGS